MIVDVESRASPQQEAEPTAFYLGGSRVGIEQVLDRWPSAHCCYFKVEADDGSIYILRHALEETPWKIIQFLAPGMSDGNGLRQR